MVWNHLQFSICHQVRAYVRSVDLWIDFVTSRPLDSISNFPKELSWCCAGNEVWRWAVGERRLNNTVSNLPNAGNLKSQFTSVQFFRFSKGCCKISVRLWCGWDAVLLEVPIEICERIFKNRFLLDSLWLLNEFHLYFSLSGWALALPHRPWPCLRPSRGPPRGRGLPRAGQRPPHLGPHSPGARQLATARPRSCLSVWAAPGDGSSATSSATSSTTSSAAVPATSETAQCASTEGHVTRRRSAAQWSELEKDSSFFNISDPLLFPSQRALSPDPPLSALSSGHLDPELLPAWLVTAGPRAEDRILDLLVVRAHPNQMTFRLAPAYLLYLLVRAALREGPGGLSGRVNRIAGRVYRVARASHESMLLSTFWMANAAELLHFIKYDQEVKGATLEAQDILAEAVQQAFNNLFQGFQVRFVTSSKIWASSSATPPKISQHHVVTLFYDLVAWTLKQCIFFERNKKRKIDGKFGLWHEVSIWRRNCT